MANEEYKMVDAEGSVASADAGGSVASADSVVEIEVVDDTPFADRGKKPLPPELVQELEADDLEEYSDKVKKRLGQMKKVWHDERREKERATREREEALRFAQLREEENKQLKQRLSVGERLYAEQVAKSTTSEITTVKARLKEAYEAGDSEAITNAQEALTDAKIKLRDYERFGPALQSPTDGVKTHHEHVDMPIPARQGDSKAEAWREHNPWFGPDTEMTALALGLHEKLIRSGVDPKSDSYYRQIDAGMKKRFPESFEDDDTTTEAKVAPRKAVNVVAPATRSTAPRQVRLTATQMALAKRFNLPPQVYADEVEKLNLENRNG